MDNEIYLTEAEINKYALGSTFADKAAALLKQQKESWDFLAKNYKDLGRVQVRNFEFDGFDIKVQYNPGRMISSSAKVDNKSISERKCFLCMDNLPKQQRSINIQNYNLLCNPYPIFTEHFTIPKLVHTPQEILINFTDQLRISKELTPVYTVFYNGPRCGASAPDHMHFQAGARNFMEIDKDYDGYLKKSREVIFTNKTIAVFAAKNYLRNLIILESNDSGILNNAFQKFYSCYKSLSASVEEPLLNIISNFSKDLWRVILIPREVHRPTYYFFEDERNILLSPASVDLGGVCITPLEKDFEKITKDQIIDIFSQVCISDEKYKKLNMDFSNSLKGQ